MILHFIKYPNIRIKLSLKIFIIVKIVINQPMLHKKLAWENNSYFTTPALVFTQNNAWGRSVEIPYWWRVNTQFEVVLLTGPAGKIKSTNLKPYPDLESDTSLVWNSAFVCQTSFREKTSDGVAKWRQFSQAMKKLHLKYAHNGKDSPFMLSSLIAQSPSKDRRLQRV